jgi:hypothetical protein
MYNFNLYNYWQVAQDEVQTAPQLRAVPHNCTKKRAGPKYSEDLVKAVLDTWNYSIYKQEFYVIPQSMTGNRLKGINMPHTHLNVGWSAAL